MGQPLAVDSHRSCILLPYVLLHASFPFFCIVKNSCGLLQASLFLVRPMAVLSVIHVLSVRSVLSWRLLRWERHFKPLQWEKSFSAQRLYRKCAAVYFKPMWYDDSKLWGSFLVDTGKSAVLWRWLRAIGISLPDSLPESRLQWKQILPYIPRFISKYAQK